MFVSQSHQVGPEDVKTDPDITVEKPKIPDLTVEEYQQQPDKSVFGRVAAVNPMQETIHTNAVPWSKTSPWRKALSTRTLISPRPYPCCQCIVAC